MHFMISANSYVVLCVIKLPEVGTLVAKRVGVGTYHELCFIVYFILLSVFVGYCNE
jgi:hypothetical protein